MSRPVVTRVLIAFHLFLAAAIVLYWSAWFAVPGLVRSRAPGAPDYALYMAFEGAFPLADGWVALASLVAAAGLWRRRAWGILWALLADGGAIFLGLIDLLYDVEQGMLLPLAGDTLVDLAIVAGLLLLTPAAVVLTWHSGGIKKWDGPP